MSVQLTSAEVGRYAAYLEFKKLEISQNPEIPPHLKIDAFLKLSNIAWTCALHGHFSNPEHQPNVDLTPFYQRTIVPQVNIKVKVSIHNGIPTIKVKQTISHP